MKRLLALFSVALLVACAQPAHFLEEEKDVDWDNWSEQNGAVVYVTDGRVGAITFIVQGGSVDFDMKTKVTVGILSLTQDGALIAIHDQQKFIPVGRTETVKEVSVTVDSIVFR